MTVGKVSGLLKTLPDGRQQEVFDFAEKHTLAQTVEWLREDGLLTSCGQLSRFCSWYRLKEQLRKHSASVSSLNELLRSKMPTVSPEKLESYTDALFRVQVLEQNKPELYLALKRDKMEAKRLSLEERRIKLLEERASKADAVEAVTHSTLSEAEKAKRIRDIFAK